MIERHRPQLMPGTPGGLGDSLELRADGLQLNLAARSHFDDHGWARVDVAFSVPNVSGRYDTWVERGDLERFISGIEMMSRTLEPESSATLATVEDDYRVELCMRGLGHIAGSYVFVPGRSNASQVSVSGCFTLDQSYLQAVVSELKSLIGELSQGESL